MSKVKSLPTANTEKEKRAGRERESCIILRKGQKVEIGVAGYDKKDDDKGE